MKTSAKPHWNNHCNHPLSSPERRYYVEKKKRKYMTESMAWFSLAKRWFRPHINVITKECYIDPLQNGLEVVGLCPSIGLLEREKLISPQIANKMLLKVKKLKKIPDSVFVWHLDVEGALQRYRYCEKQALKCLAQERKRRSKKR